MEDNGVEYNIEFYKDENGKHNTAWQYICDMKNKGDKQSRSLINTFYRKLEILRKNGTRDGMPDFRFIRGSKYKLWEIRIRHVTGFHRVFICAWDCNNFIVLNHFIKKSEKTPFNEITLAESLMDRWLQSKGGK